MTKSSKWLQIMLTSLSKAKYMVIKHKAREGVWIKYFLNKLFLEQVIKKMDMLSDNKTNLILTKDPKNQNCIKYINIIYHYI